MMKIYPRGISGAMMKVPADCIVGCCPVCLVDFSLVLQWEVLSYIQHVNIRNKDEYV